MDEWSLEDDKMITGRPWRLNTELAMELNKSPDAIQYRRAYLACKLLLEYPNLAIGIQGTNFYARVFDHAEYKANSSFNQSDGSASGSTSNASANCSLVI